MFIFAGVKRSNMSAKKLEITNFTKQFGKEVIPIVFIIICLFLSGCESISNDGSQTMPEKKGLSAEEIYKQSFDKVAMVLCYQNGIPSSQGSGFFIDKNTLITNYHVIEGSDYLELKIAGNETIYKGAKVIKASPEYDLAIVQTKQDFSAFEIVNSSKIEIGAKIYTIGNPRGLEGTISDGILSGKRNNDGIEYLQITAPISPGNSGGPVLNDKGEVIGIATFAYKNSQNLNFAVPVSYIEKCIDIDSVQQNKHTITLSDTDAISIVTYSKRRDANYQQISFKNNTNHTIKSINGVLIFRQNKVKYKHNYAGGYEYFHKSLGNIFHYQIFYANVDIAPHFSKLVTIGVDSEMIPHEYCENFCTGCGNPNYIHYHYEFRLLSYEIEE